MNALVNYKRSKEANGNVNVNSLLRSAFNEHEIPTPITTLTGTFCHFGMCRRSQI